MSVTTQAIHTYKENSSEMKLCVIKCKSRDCLAVFLDHLHHPGTLCVGTEAANLIYTDEAL